MVDNCLFRKLTFLSFPQTKDQRPRRALLTQNPHNELEIFSPITLPLARSSKSSSMVLRENLIFFFFFFLIKRKKKKKMAIVECFIQVVEKLRQNPFNNKKSLEEDSSSQHIVKTIFYFICMKQKWKSSRWHLRMTKNWISSCLFLFFFFLSFLSPFFFFKEISISISKRGMQY